MLVSFAEGTVKSTPGYDKIKALESFVSLETTIEPGSRVDRTVDIFTSVGSVILMHHDSAILKHDYDAIRRMEIDCQLFEFEAVAWRLADPERARSLSDADDAAEMSSPMTRRARAVSHEFDCFDPPPRTDKTECIVIVDPISTGGNIAAEAAARGYPVIAVYDKDLTEANRSHVPLCARSLKYHAVVEETESTSIKDVAKLVRDACDSQKLKLGSVICGSEAGVILADALSAELGVLTNGVSDGRRDKKVQQELVKAAGLRSVRQAGGTKLSDVEDFLASEPMPVVVKPVESAGSDGVKLCTSIEDAKAHFELLMSSQRKVGSQNASVLCQEFLKGKEYVIDHISRDGVHKTTMVWVYDKRRANGGDFVYYGMIPVDVNSKEAKEMIPYVRGVLDALGIKNGPTHGEVMMTQRGACLVEMNCRAHGGDGAWNPLAMELTGGFSQVNGTIDAYTSADKFAKIPDLPPSPFKAVGQNLMLVSFAEGTVKSTPGYDKIKALESFVSLETTIEPGSRVDRTIDIFTSVGSVILMHHDEEVLKRDYNAIRQMEVDCALFDFKPEAVLLGRPRARSDSL
eukprot:TRINITY_DN941_c0_g1_i6.p1 TRINITY_DN941_c0_g1~~TRINITY_DN941_c0_g1_i6.p1  ORF type:complete len:574 (-),score=113.26 TRINITY_DN941_c0_g1_i6:171-1892(-)